MEFIQHGGIFTYAILFVGFLVTLVSIERALSLYIRYRINASKLFKEIKQALQRDDVAEALEACRERGHKPLARVLEAGLVRHGKSLEEIQLSMDAEESYQSPKILERLSFLPSFANMATLLGLVGTVLGLIKSFSALGGTAVAGLNKGQALAAGVSESMYSTAGGLMVAIPAIFIHLILNARANKLLDEIDHYSLELKKLIFHRGDNKREALSAADRIKTDPATSKQGRSQSAAAIFEEAPRLKAADLKITEEQSVPAILRPRQPFVEKSNAENAAAKLAMAVQQVTRESVVNEATEAIERAKWLDRVVEEESHNPEIVAEEIRRLSQIELMKKVSEATHAGAVNAMEEVSENRVTHQLSVSPEKKV